MDLELVRLGVVELLHRLGLRRLEADDLEKAGWRRQVGGGRLEAGSLEEAWIEEAELEEAELEEAGFDEAGLDEAG